jgi:hypothetical protein
MATTCTICADTSDAATLHTLECGHSFHSECIVQWFRSGNDTCPNCRSSAITARFERQTPQQRLTSLRRRRTIDQTTKSLILKHDQARDRAKVLNRERNAFRREHAQVFRSYHKLGRMLCNQIHRQRNLLRYIDATTTVVPLVTRHAMDTDTDESSTE